jgi:hypothetical protein
MLDSWRPGRDEEGWFDPSVGWPKWNTLDTSAPEFVTAVPRLIGDLISLQHLLAPDHPSTHFVRSTKIATFSYGFGDASGDGFGSTFMLGNGTIQFCHGVWGADPVTTSSNYRELLKLVLALEEGYHSGSLWHSYSWIAPPPRDVSTKGTPPINICGP